MASTLEHRCVLVVSEYGKDIMEQGRIIAYPVLVLYPAATFRLEQYGMMKADLWSHY